MKTALIFAAAIAAAQASAAAIDWSQLPPAATNANVTFAADIQPIFKASCVRCHNGDRAQAQLRLDTLEGVLKGTKHGPALTAGDSANSLIVKAVSQLDPRTAMPPKPRARRGPRPGGGTNAPSGMQPREGGPDGGGGPPPMMGGGDQEPGGPPPGGGDGNPPPGGQPGANEPGMRPRNFGPPPKPLTAEEVGLIRAWIDQGAK